MSETPEVCRNCMESDCYNCEHELERHPMSELETLLSRKRLAESAVRRYQRIIEEINEQIAKLK